MLDPEVVIAVDATPTRDTPPRGKTAVMLGKGPAIKVWDARMLSDPRLARHIANVADEAGIACQMDVVKTSDIYTPSVQLAGAGVPWGCISIPARYVHTPSEMVDYRDVEGAVRLLLEITKRSMDFVEDNKAQGMQSRTS
jgi:endoglucanase